MDKICKTCKHCYGLVGMDYENYYCGNPRFENIIKHNYPTFISENFVGIEIKEESKGCIHWEGK